MVVKKHIIPALSMQRLIVKPRVRKVDRGTPEIQEKRRSLPLSALNLSGTIASVLVKEKNLSLEHLEIFQKIHLLHLQYLSLQKLHLSCFSHLASISTKNCYSAYYHDINENEILERTWQLLTRYLDKMDRRILSCIAKLFEIHTYESLPTQSERFIKNYSLSDIDDFAYFCWSAWKGLR